MKKILFVTSEVHPLIKTGGLADISSSLPKALFELGQDIRVILPKYRALKITEHLEYRCTIRIDNRAVNIVETRLPESSMIVWLVDYPDYFDIEGNPYVDELGNSWENNAERFNLFCRVAIEIAMNRAQDLNWRADIVHCNDWQTGLIPALLSLEYERPATIFTIHNLAYQGLFPGLKAAALHLPGQLLTHEGLEFHNMLSFIKGGIVYADKITTVSPTYALEIQTPKFGYGLEGLLAYRQDDLMGVINGVDFNEWNPESDSYVQSKYNVHTLAEKQYNKQALQNRLNLPTNSDITVLGLISRLVEQKGIDLIIDCLPKMMEYPIQFVLLGSGDKNFEQQLRDFAHSFPEKIAVTLGYDESLAHLIEAGADMFLMPSRFEPCGLNQMYSQRYGTIPIVRNTGGLADTVIDVNPQTLQNKTATGILFDQANSGSLMEAIKRAILLKSVPDMWNQVQINCMNKNFSWKQSAERYLELYKQVE